MRLTELKKLKEWRKWRVKCLAASASFLQTPINMSKHKTQISSANGNLRLSQISPTTVRFWTHNSRGLSMQGETLVSEEKVRQLSLSSQGICIGKWRQTKSFNLWLFVEKKSLWLISKALWEIDPWEDVLRQVAGGRRVSVWLVWLIEDNWGSLVWGVRFGLFQSLLK